MEAGGKTLSVTFPAEPDAVALARTALRDFALDAGADQRQVDAVRLAGSEAVTNAIVHAYRDEPGKVNVAASFVSGELWVLIADDGCGMKPRARRPGLGLGLGLISQLTDELAIVPRSGGGTEVRMRFDIGADGQSRERSAPRATSERPASGSRAGATAERPSAGSRGGAASDRPAAGSRGRATSERPAAGSHGGGRRRSHRRRP